MMGAPLELEVFDVAPRRRTVVSAENVEVLSEEQRLAAFEEGYQAGWDDSVKANGDDQARISADFAHTLQDLSFTYHEAKAHLTKAIEPLLREMVSKILPGTRAAALATTVVEVVRKEIEAATDVPVEIVVNPSQRAALEALLSADAPLPVTVSEETTLGDGQAFLRFGDTEHSVDLDDAMTRIQEAVEGFLQLNEEVRDHG